MAERGACIRMGGTKMEWGFMCILGGRLCGCCDCRQSTNGAANLERKGDRAELDLQRSARRLKLRRHGAPVMG